MADEEHHDKEEEPKKPKEKESIQLTGKQLLVLIFYLPIILVYLTLATKIIWSASENEVVLNNSESLIALLSIISTPVIYGLAKLWELNNNDKE